MIPLFVSGHLAFLRLTGETKPDQKAQPKYEECDDAHEQREILLRRVGIR